MSQSRYVSRSAWSQNIAAPKYSSIPVQRSAPTIAAGSQPDGATTICQTSRLLRKAHGSVRRTTPRHQRCRLVCPRDHVSNSKWLWAPADARVLSAPRRCQLRARRSPVTEESGRGNPGAASKIEDSRARPYQLRQVIDPSLVAIRTFVASRIGPTFIVTVRTRDRVVATAHKVAPSRRCVPTCICQAVSLFG